MPAKRQTDKFALYERAVQSPDTHVNWFVSVYHGLKGKYASSLREDFCGTFMVCCEWVKRNRRNTAMGLDLDEATLEYGKKKHWARLSADQKKRVQILRKNVLAATPKKTDLIVACNFSFFIFKQRDLLLMYFRACLRSLKSDGIMILEMAGGPGMIAQSREQKSFRDPGKPRFTYYWDQKSFDPITHDARYAIHFKLDDGTWIKDAFAYDWRLWTIPEVRDLLSEAGFSRSHVYWETEHEGRGTGEYAKTEKGDNSYAWVAYVVAER